MEYLKRKKIDTYADERGVFLPFHYGHKVEDVNIVFNKKHVLRGLHCQMPQQTKTVICIQGHILDFVLFEGKFYLFDLTQGEYVTVPKGAFHGYLTKQDSTVVYLTDVSYNSNSQMQINFWEELEKSDLSQNFKEQMLELKPVILMSEKDAK